MELSAAVRTVSQTTTKKEGSARKSAPKAPISTPLLTRVPVAPKATVLTVQGLQTKSASNA